MAYLKRLLNLEKHNISNFNNIVHLIKQGKYYDELSEEEQKEYLQYKESLGGGTDEIACAELDILINHVSKEEAYHFKLTERKPPATREEREALINEIEEYVLGKKDLDDEENY